MTRAFLFLFLIIHSYIGSSQPLEQPVKIIITPNHSNWEYNIGEKANFSIQALKNGTYLKNTKIKISLGLEKMNPFLEDSFQNQSMPYVVASELTKPGFLRCVVTVYENSNTYKSMVTVGYDINSIQSTTNEPADFDQFWKKSLNELSDVPLDIKLTPLPDKSSSRSNVFQVNIQGYQGSRIYGILCMPKKSGKHPAILNLPGAGIRPYGPDLEMADSGYIVLSIGIHGIPVVLDPSIYNNLETGALKGYFFFNSNNKDKYYYKRVYLNCIRAIDFVVSLPEFKPNSLAVTGNSQGGALSIVSAALDKRINYLAVIHPALCDLTGYFFGRAGGWPHFYDKQNLDKYNNKETKETLEYFDIANFSKRISQTGFYTWGFNDETCPPTSMFAAFNNVKSQKKLSLYLDTGHWFYKEQKSELNNWLINKLNQN